MEWQSRTAFTGFSEREKGAYFAALASLSTADRQASEGEVDHLRHMARAAGLSQQQEDFIVHAANDINGEDLKQCLDILKTSQLRFSLISDLIILAKTDGSYNENEKQNIEKVAQYLGVNDEQVSVLDEFVNQAEDAEPEPEKINQPDFLDSLGMREKFSKAGINTSGMGKNIMGMLGPLILGGLAAGALSGRGRGPMSGMGGGMLGGVLGGMVGGGMNRMGGGLGSLINGINRSRNSRSMGGLLGKLFR